MNNIIFRLFNNNQYILFLHWDFWPFDEFSHKNLTHHNSAILIYVANYIIRSFSFFWEFWTYFFPVTNFLIVLIMQRYSSRHRYQYRYRTLYKLIWTIPYDSYFFTYTVHYVIFFLSWKKKMKRKAFRAYFFCMYRVPYQMNRRNKMVKWIHRRTLTIHFSFHDVFVEDTRRTIESSLFEDSMVILVSSTNTS